MYNPAHLYECEKEKFKRFTSNPKAVRKVIDSTMTGVGLIASVSSIPQVIKIFETQTVVGISLTTQLVALGTVVTWFFYGLYIKNKPLAITTFVTIIVLTTVVVQIFIYS